MLDNDDTNDESSVIQRFNGQGVGSNNPRLIVTHEGLLDPSLLIRTEGYIYKKGGAVNARGGFRTWKKRWFELVNVAVLGHEGYELQYFDAPGGKLKGTVGLSDVFLQVKDDVEEKDKKMLSYQRNQFSITLQNGGELELGCEKSVERDEWVETLSMVITFLRRVLTSQTITLDGYDPYQDDDEENYNIGKEIAQNCQAYGPGLFGAEAGKAAQFIVQLHDRTGQQVMHGGMPLVITITNDEVCYYLRTEDNNDGTYYASYTMSKKGNYQLSVLIHDEHHIFGSPFQIEILPSQTVPKMCYAEGKTLQEVYAKTKASFNIVATDLFGNKKMRGGDPFEVGVMGPAQLLALHDNDDGTYTCELEIFTPQSVEYVAASSLMVLVTLKGRHIQGSPFKPSIVIDQDQASPFMPTDYPREDIHNDGAWLDSSKTPRMMGIEPSISGKQRGDKSIGRPESTQRSKGSNPSSQSNSKINQPSNNLQSNAFESLNPRTSFDASSLAPTERSHQSSRPSSRPVSTSRQPSNPLPVTTKESIPPVPSYRDTTPSQGGVHTNPPLTSSFQPQPSQSSEMPQLGDPQMSKLEKARQRALQAKLASTAPSNYPQPIQPSHAFQNGVGSQNRMEPTDTLKDRSNLNGTKGNNNSASKLAQAASRNAVALSALKLSSHQDTNPSNTKQTAHDNNQVNRIQHYPQQEHKQQSQTVGSSQGMVNIQEFVSHMRYGLGSATPHDIRNKSLTTSSGHWSNDEVTLWEQTNSALKNDQAISKLCESVEVLKVLYEFFSESLDENGLLLKLTTSSNRGLIRMLELYEIIPTYLSKSETKIMFALILTAQRNMQSPASLVEDGMALDFHCFVKLLIMITHHILSRTSQFTKAYTTNEAMVDVLLYKWGFGDGMKLQLLLNNVVKNPNNSQYAPGSRHQY